MPKQQQTAVGAESLHSAASAFTNARITSRTTLSPRRVMRGKENWGCDAEF